MSELFDERSLEIGDESDDDRPIEDESAHDQDTVLPATRKKKRRLRLPTATELSFLPPEVRNGIMQRVYDSLANTLYARAVFLLRRGGCRDELRRSSGPGPEKVPAAFLQGIPVFATWARLEALCEAAQLVMFPKGTIVVHAGDVSDRAMYVLVSGTLQVRPRRSHENIGALKKGCDSAVLSTYEPMSCIREHAFLALEPPRDYIRTATACALWRFSEQLLNHTLSQQTEDRQLAAKAAAIEERRCLIEQWAPLTAAQLAGIPLFADVPKELLSSLVQKCVPRTIEPNETLSGFSVTDPKPSDMLLLLRGTVTATTHTGRTFSPAAGSLLQIMPVLFPKKQPLVSLRTRTICDFYAIPREGLVTACGAKIEAMQSILKRALDDEDLRTQRSEYYRAYVATIPFVAQLGTAALIDDLVIEFKENVYPAGSSIISTSETCSGLIIPIRGMARMSVSGSDLSIGECIGFACLTPHRWSFHVTARDAVETIELHRDVFASVLEKHNVLHRIASLSTGLLFPVAHPEDFTEALAMIEDLLNPPTFPISESTSAPKVDASRPAAAIERAPVPAAALLSRKGKSALKEGSAPPKLAVSGMTSDEARQALEDAHADAEHRSRRRASAAALESQVTRRVPIAERFKQQVAASKERDIQVFAAEQNVRLARDSFPVAEKASVKGRGGKKVVTDATIVKRSARDPGDLQLQPTAADDEVHLLDGTGSHDTTKKQRRAGSSVDAETQTSESFLSERCRILMEMLQ